MSDTNQSEPFSITIPAWKYRWVFVLVFGAVAALLFIIKHQPETEQLFVIGSGACTAISIYIYVSQAAKVLTIENGVLRLRYRIGLPFSRTIGRVEDVRSIKVESYKLRLGGRRHERYRLTLTMKNNSSYTLIDMEKHRDAAAARDELKRALGVG